MRSETYNPVDMILQAYELDTTRMPLVNSHELQTQPPDVCIKLPETNWSSLDWKQTGKPYRIQSVAAERVLWEKKKGRKMPELMQWKRYNTNLHELLNSQPASRRMEVRKSLLANLKKFRLDQADEAVQNAIKLKIWNYLHRKEDALWDPRGKRTFFSGLKVKKPRILLLGAADGYDAMVMLSMYGGQAQLVDYDDFCKTDRFGKFPDAYPFLSRAPQTQHWHVHNKKDFDIEYVVKDIHKLNYGKEFDIVMSAGLIEHYPDKYKPLVFHLHRQFLKPDGYAILTASRNYAKLRTFYHLMNDRLNFTYRELMTAPQLGLLTHQNGFRIMRCGYVKAHNIVIAKEW